MEHAIFILSIYDRVLYFCILHLSINMNNICQRQTEILENTYVGKVKVNVQLTSINFVLVLKNMDLCSLSLISAWECSFTFNFNRKKLKVT